MVENLPGEVWRPIARKTKYAYYVSSEGRVKVKDETGESLVRLYGAKPDSTLMCSVNLHYGDKGIKNTNLATLIAEAFIPDYANGGFTMKRKDPTLGWTLNNMEQGKAKATSKEAVRPANIYEAKPIPKSLGLYKIAADGTVFYTPTKKALPFIETDNRRFVQLELNNGAPQYHDVEKLVAEVWGANIKAKAAPKKTAASKQQDMDFKADKAKQQAKEPLKRARQGGYILITNDELGRKLMRTGDAAAFLGVTAKQLANSLYRNLRSYFDVNGKRMVAQYPDLENRPIYLQRGTRKGSRMVGKIENVDTGETYATSNELFKVLKGTIDKAALIHNLGRYGEANINGQHYKVIANEAALLKAPRKATFKGPLAAESKTRGKSTRARASISNTLAELIPQVTKVAPQGTKFEDLLRSTYSKLITVAQTKQDFMALSELAKAMAVLADK